MDNPVNIVLMLIISISLIFSIISLFKKCDTFADQLCDGNYGNLSIGSPCEPICTSSQQKNQNVCNDSSKICGKDLICTPTKFGNEYDGICKNKISASERYGLNFSSNTSCNRIGIDCNGGNNVCSN